MIVFPFRGCQFAEQFSTMWFGIVWGMEFPRLALQLIFCPRPFGQKLTLCHLHLCNFICVFLVIIKYKYLILFVETLFVWEYDVNSITRFICNFGFKGINKQIYL